MKRQKGYLLVEVLISVMLLAIGATGFCITQLHGARSNLHASLYSNAASAGIALAEQLRLHSAGQEIEQLSHFVSTDSDEHQLPPLEHRSFRALSGFMQQSTGALANITCGAQPIPNCRVCVRWLTAESDSSSSAGNHRNVCTGPVVL